MKCSDIVNALGNFYLFEESTGILKKSVDSSSPSVFYGMKTTNYYGRTVRTCLFGQAIIIHKTQKTLIIKGVSESKYKNTELKIINPFGNEILDFRIFSEKEDGISIITRDGWIVLINFSLENQTYFVIDRIQICLKEEIYEWCFTLSVSQGSRFMLIHTSDSYHKASRLLIYELNKSILVYRDEVDLKENGDYNDFFSVQFLEQLGNHLIISAVSCGEEGSVILTFAFNIQTFELRELIEMTKNLKSKQLRQLVRVGNELKGFDEDGRMVVVRYYE